MFNRKDTSSFEKVDTLLSKNTMIDGTLTAEGTVRIDGQFTGEISIKGDLMIGEEGRVQADINARNLAVSGELQGKVTLSGKMEIASTGKHSGDIAVGSLVIDEGGVFEGSCQMHGGAEKRPEKS